MTAPAAYMPPHFASLRPPEQRASTDAIAFAPSVGMNFGNGVGNQPDHDTLLRETRGVFASGERAIANRVAGLKLEVVTARRQSDGTMKDEAVDPSHPLVQLLANPHPNISKFMLFSLSTHWLTSVGEAAWLKVGNGLGVPAELHPIPPTLFSTVWRGGVISHYIVRDGNGADHVLEQDKVVHFYFPDPERFWGSEGVLGPTGTAADIMKFAGEHGREHFRNDATPKSTLKTGASFLEPGVKRAFEENWRAAYHRIHGSARGLPAYIPSDAELILHEVQSGADVVPLLEYYRDELLMAVGVPRSILGQVVSGDRSSAEVNQYVFDRYTVLPRTRLIEDGMNSQLAGDFDPALRVRFVEFVSADKEFELKREAQDLTLKVVSVNDVLTKRGDEPATWGDLPVGTLAETPYDGSGFGGFGGGSDDDADRKRLGHDHQSGSDRTPMPLAEAAEHPAANVQQRGDQREALVRAEWQRQINREKQYVPGFTKRINFIFREQEKATLKRLAEIMPRVKRSVVIDEGGRPKSWEKQEDRILSRIDSRKAKSSALTRITASDLFDENEWADLFDTNLGQFRVDAYMGIVTDTLATLGGITDFVFTDTQAAILERQGAQLVTNVNKTTKDALGKTLAEGTLEGESLGQLEKRIKGVFDTRRKQARTIARTEVLKASQEAQVTAFEVSGVVDRKVWNTSLDDVVRDSHAPVNGQVRDLRDPFDLADGEQASAPGLGVGGGALSAGNSINCRCFVVPSFSN